MFSKKTLIGLLTSSLILTAAITSIAFAGSANAGNKDQVNVVDEYTVKSVAPAKKVKYEDAKNDLGFLSPKYVPANLTVNSVVLNEAPEEATTDKKLRDKLKTYDILYTNPEDGHESIYMIITKGGMGIGGPIEETTINGVKAELQENEEAISLSWKYKGITYWLLAHKTEKLTRDEILKFANSITK